TSAKTLASGSPVIEPTRSKSSVVPPCASMTRFAVSTTKRTLSVRVPSRSQRTARTGEAPRTPRGVASATAASRGASCGGLDRQHRLLSDATATRFLALARREALAARVARPSTADRLAVLRLARIDDPCVGMAAGWAAHDHKIRVRPPYI